MRWAVAPSVAPPSGSALNVNSVIEDIQVNWINMGRAAGGIDEEIESRIKTHACWLT